MSILSRNCPSIQRFIRSQKSSIILLTHQQCYLRNDASLKRNNISRRNGSSSAIHITSVQKSMNDASHTNLIRQNRLTRFTERILAEHATSPSCPIGSMTPAMIQETIKAIEFWIAAAKRSARTTVPMASTSEADSGNIMSLDESLLQLATNADQLLRRLIRELIHQHDNRTNDNTNTDTRLHATISIDIIQSVLDNWRLAVFHSSSPSLKLKAAEHDEALLSYVESESAIASLNTSACGVLPHIPVKSYNTVLDAWAKAGQVERVESLLKYMIHRHKDAPASSPAPDTVSYNTCLSAWAQAARTAQQHPHMDALAAAQATESWLRQMEAEHHRGNPHVIPNTISYSTVMDAWSRVSVADGTSPAVYAPHHVEDILDEMHRAYESGSNPNVKPNVITYGAAISAWAQHSDVVPEAAQRAERLLRQMEERYEETHDEDIRPTTICYNIVIDAWSNSMVTGSARRAEQILLQMNQRVDETETQHHGVQPDLHSYNTVLKAYAKTSEPGAAQRAEQLLEAMERMYEAGTKYLKPDTVSFTSVIVAWAKSPQRGSAKRAEALLWRMQRLYESGSTDIRPNEQTFTAVIDAYARDTGEESSQRAESLLDVMQKANVTPNIRTYNAVLNALAKCGYARKAEQLLQRVMDRYNSGESDVKVDTVSFNACIDAWAAAKSSKSAARAEALLKQMHELYDQGNADVQPDIISYNTALHAIANSGVPNSGHRAEVLLRQMLALSENGQLPSTVRPDIVTFNVIIHAWSKSRDLDAPVHAEDLLKRMCQLYHSGSGPKPDVISFNSTLNTWARSKRRDKSTRAIQLLRQMQDPSVFGHLKIQPNIITYNTVLNACATVSGSEEENSRAMGYVLELMKELEYSRHLRPDSLSYAAALKACYNLLPDDGTQDNLASGIFERCCRVGQVTSVVIEHFKMADPESHNRIIGSKSIADLPREWSSNVQFRRRSNHKITPKR